jgi:hypothetical protein
VGKKAVDMLFHIHIVAVSAWRHVPRVEENSCATPKQTLKNNAKSKSKMFLSHSCGTPQKFSTT